MLRFPFHVVSTTLRDVGVAGANLRLDGSHASNLLNAIADSWSLGANADDRSTNARVRSWFLQQWKDGSSLRAPKASHWLGMRLIWTPSIAAELEWFGMVSSRRGRDLIAQPDWLGIFERVCQRLDWSNQVLLAVDGTTTGRFLERTRILFDSKVLSIALPPAGERFADWLLALPERSDERNRLSQPTVFVSPDLSSGGAAETEVHSAPLRDRANVGLSDRLLVMHCRARGNIHTLVQSRMRDTAWSPDTVSFVVGQHLVSEKAADELRKLGASEWQCPEKSSSDGEQKLHCNASRRPPLSTSSRAAYFMECTHDRPMLVHCTRAQPNGWPDQSEEEHLDELLLRPKTADYSALAALRRILEREALLASRRTIRGGYEVVSFTDTPLSKLSGMNVFRRHRGRWDFEPYGIGIDREWLQSRGARAVLYGDDSDWNALNAAMRPWFQKRSSERELIDWKAEREWRHLGSVNLSELPSDCATVFVPSVNEAEQLSGICRWPLVVLPADREGVRGAKPSR